MRDPEDLSLEEAFEGLTADNYEVTSDPLSRYNCLAWAVGSTHAWWQAAYVKGYYWPPGIPKDDSLSSWVRIFEVHGFCICENGAYEPGWEKIAIYVIDGEPAHVARQL